MGLTIEEIGKMTEPEVAKAVLQEIKTLGDNFEANYTELRKNHEELKHVVDENSKDTLAFEKVQKLGEDITVRQQALDKKMIEDQKAYTQRIDAIEIALKRPGKQVSPELEEKSAKEIKDFTLAVASVQRKNDMGVSFEEVEALEKSGAFSKEAYDQYKKAFEGWARKYGGSRDRIAPEYMQKALQVGIDPDGGITVPTAMSNRVTQIVYEGDPVRQLASVESITTGKLEWMAEWDEAGSGWEGETHGETTAPGETSTPGWMKRSVSVHTQWARPRATQTLLEDSGINIESWLANKVAEKFSRDEGAAFVTGNGIGRPRGFLTYANGTTFGTVERVNMGAAAALTADGFINIKFHLKEAFLDRGTWLMNRTTVLAALLLKDGQGNYIWSPGILGQGDVRGNIVGLPIRMSTTMPAVSANALAVALADWKAAYLILDRLGITVQRDPYTVKPFVEFYTRKRVGGDVDNWEAIKIGVIHV
jgi:HK97 family phage major capsid protein